MMTTTATGAASDRMEVARDPPSSTVARTGFPRPPVPALDAPRATTVVPWTNPAIPPPAIAASVHFRNGLISATSDAVTTVPATTAAGEAMVSSRLSTHGTQ